MDGKYDIVYVVKDAAPNEELRYSLRSVEKNWGAHGRVWIFGGCPDGIMPGRFVPVEMILPTKWENIQRQMRLICECDEITEDFWYFNDDFFVMQPTTEDMPQQYNLTLQSVADLVESWSGGMTSWTEQLRALIAWAEKEGYGKVNYEVHKPMLINRKKMLAVMDKFPEVLFIRSLYGNFYRIGGHNSADILVTDPAQGVGWLAEMQPPFVSTTEDSFAGGEVGCYIRAKFPEPCKYETFPQGGAP